jgi:hypothetical protein
MHDINIPPLHLYDHHIMQLILVVQPSQLELVCINKCWLYLRAYYVSDISDGSGTQMNDDAWVGKRSATTRAHSWPSQGQPTRLDWETWRKFLRLALLSRGRRLKTPLGPWIRVDRSQPWFLDPQFDRLYQQIGDTWFFHPRLPRQSGRPLYSATGTPCNPPAHYHSAQVYLRGNAIICNGHSPILPSPIPIRKTFREYLFSSTEASAHWCFANLIIPQDDGYFLATAIRDHAASAETLKAVSDGSFKNCYGTAAWVLSCPLSPQQITGQVVVPGAAHDHSSYRSELAGVYAALLVVSRLCRFFDVSSGGVLLGCNSKSALATAFVDSSHRHSIHSPSFDLLGAIRNLLLESPLTRDITHIKAHQDEKVAVQDLSEMEKLNVAMDAAAKVHIPQAYAQLRHYTVYLEPWALWHDTTKISHNLHNTVYGIVHSSQAKLYWTRKKSMSEDTLRSIHWDALGHASQETNPACRYFVIKSAVGLCGVGKFLKRWRHKVSLLLVRGASLLLRICSTCGGVNILKLDPCGPRHYQIFDHGWSYRILTLH